MCWEYPQRPPVCNVTPVTRSPWQGDPEGGGRPARIPREQQWAFLRRLVSGGPKTHRACWHAAALGIEDLHGGLIATCIQSDCQQSAQTVSMPGLYVKPASWGQGRQEFCPFPRQGTGNGSLHCPGPAVVSVCSSARLTCSWRSQSPPHPPADKVLNI